MSKKMDANVKEHLRYTTLEYFEPVRLDIARAISEKSGIPMSEFDGGSQDTAFFHWLTSMLAVEKWIRATINEQAAMDDAPAGWEIARNKLVASAWLRLFHHHFNLELDEEAMPYFDAFARVARPNIAILKVLYYGWNRMRQLAGALGVSCWESQSLPMVKEGHFADIDEIIDESGDEWLGFMKNAYREAIMRILTEFKLLQEMQAAGIPFAMPFPKEMPEDADDTMLIEVVMRYLVHASAIRRPATVRNDGKVEPAITFGDAADSLSSKSPKILVESIYERGDGKEALIFLANTDDDRSATFLMPRLKEAGCAVTATAFAMF